MTVGIVVVNYNAGEHLQACLASLMTEGVDRIVVVDNGSSDGSLRRAQAAFPLIDAISLPHNPGYGAAMNRGAHRLDTDFVFVLNPDTIVGIGAIAKLMSVLERDSHVGVVGPRLEDTDGSLYPSARQFPSFIDAVGHAVLGIFWAGNPWSKRYKMLDWDHQTEREVDWISGAAMLFRRAAFESVGGFDESYFMYMEDVDLCWRLRKAGWTVAYEPSCTVVHVRGVSTDPTPYRMIVAHHHSLLRYNLRTASGFSRILLPLVVAGLAVRVPVACFHRYWAGRMHVKSPKSTPESSDQPASRH